jgi:hypothetical protein
VFVRQFLPLLVPAALAATGLAQSLTPFSGARLGSWAHHTTYPGAITAVARGSFSSFGHPDIVFLKGDRAFWAVAPAMFDWIVPLPGAGTGVQALAVLPPEDGIPGAGSALLATASGLQRWRSTTMATEPWGSTPWPGVDILRLDTDHRAVGALRGGTAVHVGNQTQAPTTWSAQGNVLDVMPVEWDGDADDEIAVATTAGMFVHDTNGALLLARPYPQSHAHLARVRFAAAEGLAAAIAIPGAGWFLSAASSTWEEITPLPYAVGALSVGDTNGDGYDDLALSRADSQCLDVVMNLGALGLPWFPFAATSGFEVQIATGTGIANNAAGASIGDLDGDGDGDVFYPLHSQPGTFARGSAPLAGAADVAVSYVAVGITPDQGHAPHSGRQLVHCDVDVTNRPTLATHVELIAWRVDGGGADSVMQRERLTGNTTSLTSSARYYGTYGTGLFATDAVEIDFSQFEAGSVAFCLQFVRLEGSDRVQAWPPRMVLVTNDPPILERNAGMPGAVLIGGGAGGTDAGDAIVIPVVPPTPPAPPAPPTTPPPVLPPG